MPCTSYPKAHMESILNHLFSQDYSLARMVFQRGMAVIYLIAFIVALNQFRPLLGETGLLPVTDYMKRVNFWQEPSIFHWHYSDRFFAIIAWLGIVLSGVALIGFSDKLPWWGGAIIWAILWILYLSIVNVGQRFYSFGWETMLLEAGFLTIFIGNSRIAVPLLIVFLLRWMLFRLEFGAGMIKMRGDECWRDLTCMNYHHETQPMGNWFSWHFHNLPTWMHKIEVLGNHFFQLIVPWGLFFPQPVAAISGLLIILSQLWLVLSGNFSWLNWLTIVLCISAFNNAQLSRLIPQSVAELKQSVSHQVTVILISILLITLSWWPLRNLFAKRQLMNAGFNSLHLVNAYGAFGTITKQRMEIVIEGTDELIVRPETPWKAYEFKAKPTDPHRRPPQFAPYHLRLDWLMWFQAFRPPGNYETWFVRFVEKLLQGDEATLKLIKHNPFPDKPPAFIRARYYRYEFTTPEERKQTGQWWKRTFVSEYMQPVFLKPNLER